VDTLYPVVSLTHDLDFGFFKIEGPVAFDTWQIS